MLLASLFEPPAALLVLPELVFTPENTPSILNLTRTLPLEVLPVLAAQRTQLETQTAAAAAPFAAAVTADPRWHGYPIRFSVSPEQR